VHAITEASLQSPTPSFDSTQRSGEVQTVSLPLGETRPSLVAGYRRHLEFDAGNHAGQDWCGFRVAGPRFAVVVADGVSQSFMGDIAARVMGSGLVDAIAREGEAALAEPRSSALLTELRATAQAEVDSFALGGDIPEFLRGTLEVKRSTTGSQTVVAAIALDLTTGRGRLLLIGDVTVTIQRENRPPLEVTGDRRARWSTLHGLRGNAVLEALDGVTGFVIATDGLPAQFARDLAALSDVAQVRTALSAGAERDDACFVALIPTRLSDAPSPPMAPPERIQTTAREPVEEKPSAAPVVLPPTPSPLRDARPNIERDVVSAVSPTATKPWFRRWRTILVFALVLGGASAYEPLTDRGRKLIENIIQQAPSWGRNAVTDAPRVASSTPRADATAPRESASKLQLARHGEALPDSGPLRDVVGNEAPETRSDASAASPTVLSDAPPNS
jgi:hypothetical protein